MQIQLKYKYKYKSNTYTNRTQTINHFVLISSSNWSPGLGFSNMPSFSIIWIIIGSDKPGKI